MYENLQFHSKISLINAVNVVVSQQLLLLLDLKLK